jgi:transposase InsO family protein
VMPFGLCNAPATFQRLMDIVLSGLNFEICLVYLDDVIIFGSTPEQHLDRLGQVFGRLREANLKLKPSKCRLMQRTVSFLGHIVTQDGVAVDPSKIRDVVEWPVPQRLRDVRAFLGLCSYYRRFIRDFSVLASPLFALTQKGRAFVWDETCREAFDRLKTVLTTTPILALPKDEGTYVLDCDACDVGIGAVLSQRIDGEERVIAFGSRLLSATERNYCVTRKELLAIVHFTKAYRQYLLGRAFVLRTDHAALQWLQRTPEPIGQQGRWLERLAEFEFQVIHRAGKKHGNADALSRKPCRQCGMETSAEVAAVTEVHGQTPASADDGPPDDLEKAQREDPDLSKVRSWLDDGAEAPDLVNILYEDETVKTYWHQKDQLYVRDGVMHRRTPDNMEQVLVPRASREEFLRLAHTGMTGGHLGVRRTRWQVRRRAYWVGWSRDVKRFCRCCPQCNRYHRGQPPRQGPLQPLPCGEPWERLGIDITGPHPRSRRGHIYILTVMDYFTKYVEAIPMANQEATSVAKALVENVIVRYGAPLQILTDQGTNFDGNLFRELCGLLGIDKVRTSSYRPSTNGLIERFHRTLNAMLGKVVSSHQRDWDEVLPHVLAAYRASLHETTGFSPNLLMFGRETRSPLDLVYGRPPDAVDNAANYSTYVRDLADRMESAYRLAREHLRVAAERRKRKYDLRVREKEFAVGDRVWYYTPRRYRGRSPKWEKMYTGPYIVDGRHGPLNYRIRKTATSRPLIVHVDKLRPCYEEGPDDAEETPEGAPPEVDETEARPRRTIRRPVRFQ